MHSIRKIPAVAWLGASLLIAAECAAQTPSSVTVYGIVDACVGRSSLGDASRNYVNGGCLFGSRLGFRGSESLGGGVRAYFHLEQGFTSDTGQLGQGGRAFGRKSLVGLGGGAGSLELGRDYAPAFYIVQPSDPMGLGIGSASNTIWTGAPSSGSARVDNSIGYLSPNVGGFSLRVQIAPGEQTAPATTRGGDVKGLNLLYRSGGTLVGLSHARVANSANSNDDRATTLVAKQQFGDFSVSGMVQNGAWKGTRSAAAPSSASSMFSRSYRSYLLGGSVRAGVGTFHASYKRYDDRTVGNFDATQWSVNYVHPLSKRTDVYAGYSRLKNQRASSYSVSDATGAFSGVTPGASTSIFAVGIKHVF